MSGAERSDVCSQVPLDPESPEIRFDPGSSSGTVADVARLHEARRYRLTANAGQRIEVSLDAPHLICFSNASGLVASGVGDITSVLPATGEFTITVVALDDSDRYTMTVAIP